MKITAIDSDFKERFYFDDCNADFAVGNSENSFQIDFSIKKFEKYKNIKFVNVDETECGGQVNRIIVNTANDTFSISGKTWRGILDEKIIIPEKSQDYYTVGGKANEIIETLLNKVGLQDFFTVEKFSAPLIKNFSFDRYCTLLEGLVKMLASVDFILKIRFENGKVIISAIQNTKSVELDNYDCDFEIVKTNCPVNHLICLGKGELKNRQVINLFLSRSGNVVDNQEFFNVAERCAVYDYPNVESLEELKKSGTSKLIDLSNADEKAEMTFNSVDYEIGQTVTAYEHYTGQQVIKKVSKKILTITAGNKNIKYELED